MRALKLAHLAVDDVALAGLQTELSPLTEIQLRMLAVRRLEWIDRHTRVLMDQGAWEVAANCYAYAAGDDAPVNGSNGGARPGQASGVPAVAGPAGALVYADALLPRTVWTTRRFHRRSSWRLASVQRQGCPLLLGDHLADGRQDLGRDL